MKRSTITTVLTLTVFASRIWGQAAPGKSPITMGAALRSSGDAAMPAGDGRHAHHEDDGVLRTTGMMGTSAANIDHVEGPMAFLRAELKITEAQASA